MTIPHRSTDKGSGKGYLKWLVKDTDDDLKSTVQTILDGNESNLPVEPETSYIELYSEEDKSVFGAKDKIGMMQISVKESSNVLQSLAAGGLLKRRRRRHETS